MTYIPNGVAGIDGIAWAQPVADVLSVALVAALCLAAGKRPALWQGRPQVSA